MEKQGRFDNELIHKISTPTQFIKIAISFKKDT